MHKFCILFHVNSGESCEYPQNPPHGKWDCFTHGKPVNRRGLITAAADGEYEPYQGNHDSHFIALQKKCHNKSVQGRAGLTESCLEHVNLRCPNMVSSIMSISLAIYFEQRHILASTETFYALERTFQVSNAGLNVIQALLPSEHL